MAEIRNFTLLLRIQNSASGLPRWFWILNFRLLMKLQSNEPKQGLRFPNLVKRLHIGWLASGCGNWQGKLNLLVVIRWLATRPHCIGLLQSRSSGRQPAARHNRWPWNQWPHRAVATSHSATGPSARGGSLLARRVIRATQSSKHADMQCDKGGAQAQRLSEFQTATTGLWWQTSRGTEACRGENCYMWRWKPVH
jgi:hypothetical protein